MKSILFKPDMIKAITEGRKTQTRRLSGLKEINLEPDMWFWQKQFSNDKAFFFSGDRGEIIVKPRYQVGETVYIKEAWRVGAWDENEGNIAVDYKLDNYKRREWLKVPEGKGYDNPFERLWIQSTDDCISAGLVSDEEGRFNWTNGDSPCRWHSPMMTPAWAARYFIQITDVRAERLQEISEADALSEGISMSERTGRYVPGNCDYADWAYHILWDSINKPPNDWNANPWVWVYSFKLQEAAK